VSKKKQVLGRLIMQKQGYGFVELQERGQGDVYVSGQNLQGALHQDLVMVRLLYVASQERRAEGEIVRVVERANETIVGTLVGFSGEAAQVKPIESRIPYDVYIPKGKTMQAKDGQQVVVRITRWPQGRQGLTGEVVEILGAPSDPKVPILAVARRLGLPPSFPIEVRNEVQSGVWVVKAEDVVGRRDLRQHHIITIDGADAKDLDDAVEVQKLPNGNFLLGVHIADVAHYVPGNSHIDREAFFRGTSIYLLNTVIPMLPPELSNGICSLNPGVDRLALSVEMEFDRQGQVQSYDIFESVIKTAARLTYDEVNALLSGEDAELSAKYAVQVPQLRLMAELRQVLLNKREQRGAMDFALAEPYIVLDTAGRVQEIKVRGRTLADSIIEEFMVAANELIAERFAAAEAPFVYRVHEEPRKEKVEELNVLLNNFGLRVKLAGAKVKPQSFREVMLTISGRPEERLINQLLLRSLMRARYSPECTGHFGLAAKYYCHFTSPIRRYPDLLIHRIIKEWLRDGRLGEKSAHKFGHIVAEAAKQSTERELLATEAERAVDDLKKAEFMSERVGEVFDGHISGVTSFGLFVELPNTVAGLVPIASLEDDYYLYDREAYSLIGRRYKKRFRLGDAVRVRVEQVNLAESTIDFSLVRDSSSRNAQ